MDTILESSWSRAWHGLHAAGNGHSVRDAVLQCYSEPHRHYHTNQHLQECLVLFDRINNHAERPHEVEMALWFHDAIYDLNTSDNEERSAAWAVNELLSAKVDFDASKRVHDLIISTKHTELPADTDDKIVIDIDLAILGATAERFAQYEKQIRLEYSYVSDTLFRMKRMSVLNSFLDRKAIYATPLLHLELEDRARINLLSATR